MIIPKPEYAEFISDKKLNLHPNKIMIDANGFDKSCYSAFLKRMKFQCSDAAGVKIIVCKSELLAAEEYELNINSEGVLINAAEECGVIYALVTLLQLIDQHGFVPHCRIKDKPKYQHRGLSLDCVRSFFYIDDVKKIIEQMSLVKLNTLHWHLSDDQGWRIESLRYPKLHEQNSDKYYTQEEIKDIVAFAALRGIDIVPEIDMPGHMTGLLAAYPEHSCSEVSVGLAKCGGVYPVILCAGKDSTFSIVEDLLDEICSLFPASRFHIGGDEAPKKEWRKCPHCKKRMRENNLCNEEDLQGYFSNRISDMLKKHGKKAICWNDSLEANNLNSDIDIQFWSVQYAEFFHKLVDNGGKFIYSDMFTFYFDYPYSMTPLRRVYNDPIQVLDTDYANHDALLGIEACVWSEYIDTPERLETLLFPRLYAVAERAWSTHLDYDDFKYRLMRFVSLYHPAHMGCTPPEGWNPRGQARQQETISHMKAMKSGMTEEIRKETKENIRQSKLFDEKFLASFFNLAEDAVLLSHMK